MDYLKIEGGGRASPKRELRSSKSRQQQKSMMSNLMEAITQVNGGGRGGGVNVSETNENGVVRKQDLRQVLVEAMNSSPSSLSVEQQLYLLRGKHHLRSNAGQKKSRGRRRCWKPVLQSIPEEEL
ncbi:VWFA domain-containing protein [Melia azedarach]|uniref:VWFA domain-containing protein n=1 Tax=Melia azedarach TaxID=155640 RepID=A0ACC1XX60_MELAZ|nr:VWFA domain-containing protein [Melia azedarach]